MRHLLAVGLVLVLFGCKARVDKTVEKLCSCATAQCVEQEMAEPNKELSELLHAESADMDEARLRGVFSRKEAHHRFRVWDVLCLTNNRLLRQNETSLA